MKALLVLALLALTIPCYGEVTIKEEGYLKATLAKEQLTSERGKIIAERDALLLAEDVKCNSAKQKIIDTYELTIDAKESEINEKISVLDNIIADK